jgi:uncharacterized membrane protein YphA (DoxX/SURF4 family)
MDKRTVSYWICTGLLAALYLFGGVVDLMAPPDVVKGMAELGYPVYFARLLGVWKLLAVAALLAPGFARLKEWAYAGIMIDLTSAAVSHTAVGDPAAKVIIPLIILVLAFASWWLRPASRVLAPPILKHARTSPARDLAGSAA